LDADRLDEVGADNVGEPENAGESSAEGMVAGEVGTAAEGTVGVQEMAAADVVAVAAADKIEDRSPDRAVSMIVAAAEAPGAADYEEIGLDNWQIDFVPLSWIVQRVFTTVQSWSE
jgi:hypothetical protein